MTNGDKLRKQLAGQLFEETDEQSSGSNSASRRDGIPFFPRGRGRDQQVDFTDNPLFLASDVAVPEGFTAGDVPALQFRRVGPPICASKLTPVNTFAPSYTYSRQRSYGSYSTASDQTSYASATYSPRARGSQESLNEIVEVTSMPRSDSDHNVIDVPNISAPIDVTNLNVIGGTPELQN